MSLKSTKVGEGVGGGDEEREVEAVVVGEVEREVEAVVGGVLVSELILEINN